MSKQNLKVLPLGGLGEIGRNMTVIEWGRHMIVVDCGVMFPDSDLPGIDLVLPDFQYLVEHRAQLRGIVLTHAHQDHIGALPFLLRALPDAAKVPLYGSRLTLGLVEADLKDSHAPVPELVELADDGSARLGPFAVHAFHVTHSIPGALGLVIETPVGKLVHTGDYKLDPTPVSGKPTDLKRLARLTRDGVLALLGDSTNADRPGRTPSEQVVKGALAEIFGEAEGRIIIATFASQLDRIQQIVQLAAEAGRKVALAGRSMLNNVDVAQRLGYLDVPDGVLVDLGRSSAIPDRRLVILATGSQGEPTSALSRIAAGEYRGVTIHAGDTVIMSSHPIPGNEELVGRVINQLFERGATVIYDRLANVHVSGHGSREELGQMLDTVKPRYLLPLHGEARHRHLHAQLGVQHGLKPERIFVLSNGQPWKFDGHQARVDKPLPLQRVLVDGASIGDISEPVLRDRERLAEEGFVVVLLPVNRKGELSGEPTLISRGFVHLDASGNLLQAAQAEVKRLMRAQQRGDKAAVVGEGLRTFLYRNTRRNPLILPRIVQM